jgi:hypothetical protein
MREIARLAAENASLRAVIAEAQEIVRAALDQAQAQPGVTEAMVEAAAAAIWEHADDEVGWKATLVAAAAGDTYLVGQVEWYREEARAALTAALGFPTQPQAVTEAMVERACEAFFDGDGCQWDESSGADHVRASMRAALTAALSAQQGEGT